MGFALLGMIVFGILIAAGIYWFITNVSFDAPSYSYRKDEDGNDVVVTKRNDDEKDQ
jgi:hypothetical protein